MTTPYLNIDKHYTSSAPRNFNPRRRPASPSKSFESAVRCIFKTILPDRVNEIDANFVKHINADLRKLRFANQIYSMSPTSNEFFYTLCFIYNINIVVNCNSLYTQSLVGYRNLIPVYMTYDPETKLFDLDVETDITALRPSYQVSPGISKYQKMKLAELRAMCDDCPRRTKQEYIECVMGA